MFNPFKAVLGFFTGTVKDKMIDIAVEAILLIVDQQISDQEAYTMGTKIGKKVAAKLKKMFGEKPGRRVEDLLQLKANQVIAGIHDKLDEDDV